MLTDLTATRLQTVSILVTTAAALQAAEFAQGAQDDPPHVVFIVGEGEYQSQDTMPALAERLEESFGWEVTVLLDEELHAGEENHVEGLEVLDEADLAVLYLRFRQWPDEDLAALQGYIDRGGAIAAFRTSTHAFLYEDEDDPRARYNDFGAEVLGAPWIYHYGHDSSTAVSLAEGAHRSPILGGVDENFEVRSWTYHVRPDFPPEDARLLLVGAPLLPEGREDDGGPEAINPVAWTRTHPGGGRVFMTTMGHPEDFHVESFRRLIGNGLHWALDLPVPVDTIEDLPEFTHPDDLGNLDGEWHRMDYGPFLSTAVSIGDDLLPVHKGVALQLRNREGELTEMWALYDVDTASLRCVWEGELALHGIVFDGPHGTFPEIDGEAWLRTEATAAFSSTDQRSDPFGPLAPDSAQWRGLRLDGNSVILEYATGATAPTIVERAWVDEANGIPTVIREFTTDALERTVEMRLYDESISHSALRARATGAALDGAVLTLRPKTTARVALSIHGAPEEPAPAELTAKESVRRAAGRWGEPVGLSGVLDEAQGEGDVTMDVSAAEMGPEGLLVAESSPGSLSLAGDGSGKLASSYVLKAGAEVEPVALRELVSEDALLGLWTVGDQATEAERNDLSGRADLVLEGVTWRRGVRGRALDFDGTAAAWPDGRGLDFAASDATVAAWIQTTSDGTVFSRGPRRGEWAPDGVSLFVREGRLSFDVGWVGDLDGGPSIADGAWHHVAVTWRHREGEVRLFVDGERVAVGELPLEGEEQEGFASRFGWTNVDFPATSRFSGYMDGLVVLGAAVEDRLVGDLAAAGAEPLATATLVSAAGDDGSARLQVSADGSAARLVPGAGTGADSGERDRIFQVKQRRGHRSAVEAWAAKSQGKTALSRPFRIDRIDWPAENEFDSWMRFGAFDFLPAANGSPEAAMITTWSGDVWRVDGLDESLAGLRWTRFATGLNQPFGILCEPDKILVLGRDQITALEDSNGDGEADHYRCFSAAPLNSQHFHEPASGLARDAEGRLVWIKAARHARLALHDHHGTVVRLAKDGATTEILARGFRAPIGLTLLEDGAMLASDQEGHWMPANRINLIRPDGAHPPFHGNGWGARPGPFERVLGDGESAQPPWDSSVEPAAPLCWIHPEVDRSPSSQLVANHPAWGPLQGQILGLSYGTGEVYLVLREDLTDGEGAPLSQGGVVKLGIQLPTGLLQGRIHPATGDLYVCGLFGWSSDSTQPGGFYRVRPQREAWESSLNVPTAMRATAKGLELTFLAPLDPTSAASTQGWSLSAWNYRRTSDYGSPTIDLEGREDERTELEVSGVELDPSRRTVTLAIEDFQPCMQLHVAWDIRDAARRPLRHSAHLTINGLAD